jgi:putative ABC transport system permease protein
MLRWTFKSLVSEPLSFLASLAATSCAFLLVILFEAMFTGEAEQIVAYVRNAGADVWVMQRDVANMHMATSYMQDWKVKQVEEVEGVSEVDSILYLYTVVEAEERPWFAFIVGLDPPARLAGPWAMVGGRGMPERGEAVVPAVFAEMYGLSLGGQLRIADHEFTVAGLSDGTFSMANSVIFVPKNDLEDVMSSLDIVSYVLVKAGPGVDPASLAARIKSEVEEVNALTYGEFLHNDREMAMQMGVEIIAMMTMVAGALAVLLVAFTIYSHTDRRRRELAVVKALGAGNSALYLSAAVPAIVLSLAGVVTAVGAAWVLVPAVKSLVPIVTLKVTGSAVLRAGAAGVIVAIFASLAPVRRIAGIDPVSAFHS